MHPDAATSLNNLAGLYATRELNLVSAILQRHGWERNHLANTIVNCILVGARGPSKGHSRPVLESFWGALIGALSGTAAAGLCSVRLGETNGLLAPPSCAAPPAEGHLPLTPVDASPAGRSSLTEAARSKS